VAAQAEVSAAVVDRTDKTRATETGERLGRIRDVRARCGRGEELATSTGTMFGARKIDGANADASGLSSSPSWRCATRDSRSTRRVAVFRPALAREVFPRGMAADG
jgi:hypothetical protein